MKASPLMAAAAISYIFAAASLSAAEYTATQSGDWSDATTWGGAGIPGSDASDKVKFDKGVTVTLSESKTLDKINYNAVGADDPSAVLNITGQSTEVNFTGVTQLWYNTRLNLNILDGANVNFATFALGNLGYNNIHVEDASLSMTTVSEWRGSKVADGSFLTVKGTVTESGGVKSSTAKFSVGGTFTVAPNEDGTSYDNAGRAVLNFNGASFEADNWVSLKPEKAYNTATFNFSNNAIGSTTSHMTLEPVGENSRAYLNLSSGSEINIGGELKILPSGANSQSYANISNATINVANNTTLQAKNGSVSQLKITDGGIANLHSIFVRSEENSKNEIVIFGSGSKIVTSGTTNTILGNGSDKEREGAKAANSTASMTFGGFDENGKFVAADKGAYKGNYQFFVNESGSLNFLLGASNAQSTAPSASDEAILQAQYFKTVLGDFNVDLRNVDAAALGKGYHYFCLISSTEDIKDGKDWNGYVIDWENTIEVTDGEYVKYDKYYVENNKLYIGVNVLAIPEPSAYAALLGAIALAFAAYRRRK